VRFRGDIGPDFVTISPNNLELTKEEFLHVKASRGSRQLGREKKLTRKAQKRARRTSPGLPTGVVDDKTGGENLVAQAATKLSFPLYYPQVRLSRGSYTSDGSPRIYDIYDTHHRRYRAYRLVVATGLDGQYYGVQGMTWKSPPILDDASSTTRMRGRTYKLFYDGTRLRLVSWSTPRAVYWISNTLSETLTSKQMLAIARSLTRFGGK
jgi:hypothetical protein